MKRLLAFASVVAILQTAASTRAAEPGDVKIIKGADTLEFRIGAARVTRYNFGEKVFKPYFWPVMAPGNVPVTRSWPMKEGEPMETKDHVHQKSAWFCHGDVIPEGIELKSRIKNVEGVDFWSENANAGRIVCVEVGTPSDGTVTTRNEWRTKEGVKIMDETRVISLRKVGDSRLIVLDIDLHASVCPITFGDTKEGSMGVRVNDVIRLNGKGTGMVTSSSGDEVRSPAKDNLPMWGRTADWHDYSGDIDGKTAGIAIFDDPRNSSRAYWHTRAYGLMAANPFGRTRSFPGAKGKTDLVKLAKGEHLKLRYGILLHAGDAKSAKVAEAFDKFAKSGAN